MTEDPHPLPMARYAPARVLPVQRFVPGLAPRPAGHAPPAGRLVDRDWRDHSDYLYGVDLYNHGFAWEAHEVWEAVWRASADPERLVLQALIQLAGAHLKSGQGELRQALRLLRGARAKLAVVAAARRSLMGLDLVALGDRIDRVDPSRGPGAFPRLRLQPAPADAGPA